ncbi:MAG: hypothetical protein WCW87_02255 [Candidatus Paceibacterota bacterium]
MLDSFLEKMLSMKLNNLPAAEKEKMMGIIKNNPDFFRKIVLEVNQKIKEGKSQLSATMEVMKAHEDELKNLI